VGSALLQPDRQDDRGEEETHCAGDRRPVEVAFGNGGTCRRLTEPPTEHVGQTATLPAVEQDHPNEKQGHGDLYDDYGDREQVVFSFQLPWQYQVARRNIAGRMFDCMTSV
jgi:hypothetical protein